MTRDGRIVIHDGRATTIGRQGNDGRTTIIGQQTRTTRCESESNKVRE